MDAPGKQYVLMTETLGSLDIGSPLYYRDIPAGEVLGYTLSKDDNNVEVHLFIRAPYHRLVQENTRFWKVSGVDFSINAEGITVNTESLQSLLMGGLAFDTPETLKKSSTIRDNHLFWLYDNKAAIAEQAYTRKLPFVLFFDESVRGLSVGCLAIVSVLLSGGDIPGERVIAWVWTDVSALLSGGNTPALRIATVRFFTQR